MEQELDIERYDRQIPVIGIDGQRKLAQSSVLIAGVGGLGSPVSLYLVAMGIGTLVLVDDGEVELSNLNRQILYSTHDIGKRKVDIAKRKLQELNPHVNIEVYAQRLNEELARDLVKRVDVVVDALDNWETRMILNKVCVEYRKPLVHAGVEGFYGQVMTIVPGKGPCLACLFTTMPPSRTRIPVMGITPGVLGTIEAAEVVKVLLSIGKPLIGRMLIVDLLSMEFRTIEVKRNPQCPGKLLLRWMFRSEYLPNDLPPL